METEITQSVPTQSPIKKIGKSIVKWCLISLVFLLAVSVISKAFDGEKPQREEALMEYSLATERFEFARIKLCESEKNLARASLQDHGNGLFKLLPDQAKSLTYKRDEMECDSFTKAIQ